MKCLNCKKEWIVVQGFRYPEKCPFCGLNIHGNNTGSGILGWIVKENGNDILKHKKRLIAFIRDLFRDEILEKRLIVAVNSGVSFYYFEASNLTGLQRQNQINQATKLLKETLGFGDDAVKSILEEFDASIGISHKNDLIDYHDADDAYYNMALNATRKNFLPLLQISVDAGNKKAIKKYISLIRDNWERHLEEDEWFRLNRMIASIDDEDSRNAYMTVLMHDLYDDNVDEFDCIDELYEMCPYADDAEFEMSARGFIFGVHSNYSVKESIIHIYSLAEKDYEPAVSIRNVLEEEFNIQKYFFTISGIEDVLDVYRPADEDSLEYDKRNLLQSEICYIVGDFYKDDIKKRVFWHDKSMKYAEETCLSSELFDYRYIGYELGKLYLDNNEIKDVDKGLEILELVKTDESLMFLSKTYLEGKLVERNLTASIKYLMDENLIHYRNPDVYYEKGKRYFYGLGCEIDIKESIFCFERYLDEKIYDPNDEGTFICLYKTIPFLTELYYEDLMINNSVDSLNKLQNYAEYHGNKMAQRYLWRYYSDKDNLYRDSRMAGKFKRLYIYGKRRIYKSLEISMLKIVNGLELLNGHLENIALDISLDNNECIDALLSFSNHLLRENDGERDNFLANSYYAVAELLFKINPRNPICRVRIINYLDNYFLLTDDKEDDKYLEALQLWIKIWAFQISFGQEFAYHKPLKILNCIKRRNGDVDKNIEGLLYSNLYDKYNKEKNYWKAAEYLEKLCKCGFDCESALGAIKFIYLKQIDEGYLLINNAYNKYLNGESVYIFDIGYSEYLIGFYRLLHRDRFAYLEAISLWKAAIDHCGEDGSGALNIMGECMRDGAFYDDDLDVTITVQTDYLMAFDAFCKGAMFNDKDCIFNMAEMLENGIGFPVDLFAAKDFYQVAREAGSYKAEERIRNLDISINAMIGI